MYLMLVSFSSILTQGWLSSEYSSISNRQLSIVNHSLVKISLRNLKYWNVILEIRIFLFAKGERSGSITRQEWLEEALKSKVNMKDCGSPRRISLFLRHKMSEEILRLQHFLLTWLHPRPNTDHGWSQACPMRSGVQRLGESTRLLLMWPGLDSRFDANCGLSWLILYSSLRGLFSRFSGFHLSSKTKLWFNLIDSLLI